MIQRVSSSAPSPPEDLPVLLPSFCIIGCPQPCRGSSIRTPPLWSGLWSNSGCTIFLPSNQLSKLQSTHVWNGLTRVAKCEIFWGLSVSIYGKCSSHSKWCVHLLGIYWAPTTCQECSRRWGPSGVSAIPSVNCCDAMYSFCILLSRKFFVFVIFNVAAFFLLTF